MTSDSNSSSSATVSGLNLCYARLRAASYRLRARQHRLTTPSLPFTLLVLLGDWVASFDQHDVVVEEYVPAEIEAPDQGDAELAADGFLGMDLGPLERDVIRDSLAQSNWSP